MPNFPNINTLTSKLNLTGDEIIQISATEKTALSAIAKLAFGQALSDFVDDEDIDIYKNEILSTDTLQEALQKLMARVGKNKYALYPFKDAFEDNNCGIVGYILDDDDETEYLFALYWDNNYILHMRYLEKEKISSSFTLDSMLYELQENGEIIWLNNMETFNTPGASQGVLTLYPGRSAIVSTASTLKLKASDWNAQDYHLLVDSSSAFLFTSNMLKSQFSIVNDVPGVTLTAYFSENFDVDPGTTIKAIAIQAFKSGNNLMLLINKCGYETISS